jgi:hypothetical protein
VQRLAARRLHAPSGSQTQFLVIAPLVAVLLMAVLPNLQRPARQTSLRRKRRRDPGGMGFVYFGHTAGSFILTGSFIGYDGLP